MLDLIRDRMMQPDAVEAFVAAYTQEINAGRDGVEAERRAQQKELAAATAKLEGLIDAIAGGLRSPGLQAKLEELETEKLKLEQHLAGPAPSPVRLHPNLSDLYREKVATLRESLAEPSIRDEAVSILRALIERVVEVWSGGLGNRGAGRARRPRRAGAYKQKSAPA